jgi:xanthine dehydrogenase accessory factor
VAQALVGVLKNLQCHVTCIDPREEWIKKFSGITAICHPHPPEVIKNLDPKTFFVSVTMGHAHDFPVLLEIFKTHPEARYVGCLGSEVKAIKLKRELAEAGVTKNFLDKLHLPMGMPIGNNDPHEIAISIAAQLLQVRDTQHEK